MNSRERFEAWWLNAIELRLIHPDYRGAAWLAWQAALAAAAPPPDPQKDLLGGQGGRGPEAPATQCQTLGGEPAGLSRAIMESERVCSELAYNLGWHACARWAKRSDLHADVDSPAFLRERAAFLNGERGATEVAREAEHGPGAIPRTGLREQCESKDDPGVTHGGEPAPAVSKAAAGSHE